MRVVTIVCTALALVAGRAAAQDPVKVAGGNYKLVAENDRVRVLHGTMTVGTKTPMHEHPAHVVVALSGGTVRMTGPDGKSSDVAVKADEAMVLPAGKHIAEATAGPVDVILVEMKGAPGSAMLPASRPGMTMTTLLDDARVRVSRVTADATFQELAGTTHDYDQVIVPLGSGSVNLKIAGKTISTWKRGDAQLVGKGIAHESRGSSKSPDLIIVAVK